MANSELDFNTFPETERYVDDLVQEVCERNEDVQRFADRVRTHTATRLRDWVESFTLSGALLYRVEELGYRLQATLYGQKLYTHPRGVFPALRIYPGPVPVARGLTIQVESLSVFRYLSGYFGEIDGTPGSPYSRILLSDKGGVLLFAAERNANVWMPVDLEYGELHDLLEAHHLMMQRRRLFEAEEEPWKPTERLIHRVLGLVGSEPCASLFLEQERRFWEARNTSARFLKTQQDRLGLGWGNHDHHTFRCRRPNFFPFVRLLEQMGFARRESFRVPSPASPAWGVLILEHPGIGAVVSADTDVLDGELERNFGGEPLETASSPGTIGLWTGLHGDSIFEAGMHHLGARYNYDALRQSLKTVEIEIMEPFTDLPHLRQAYVHGERWMVPQRHLSELQSSGDADPAALEKIRTHGILGSFLECTHRSAGYRGFAPSHP